MGDVLFFALSIVFFAASLGLVHLFEKLRGQK